MLDTETDTEVCLNVQDILVYMLQILGPNNLTHWLQLCKDVLAITEGMIQFFLEILIFLYQMI